MPYKMMLQVMVLVIVVQYTLQTTLTMSPAFNNVLENSTLELTCHASENQLIKWGTLDNISKFSWLAFSKEGECKVISGFLNKTQYFDTECYSNGTFKVTIKHVNISYHGQEWICSNIFTKSNTALINVQVPIKYVKFKRICENVLKTVEMNKTTITCETSEGRPVANITWRKISNEGIIKDLTNEAVYHVSRQETVTEKNMTIVTSSIAFIPVKEDNNSRIICEATNIKSYVAKKEITMYVQYPPSRPVFAVGEKNLNGSIRFIKGKNESVLCKSDSYPHPTYQWSTTGRSENGKYLKLSKINKSDTWQCTATNSMMLPNTTMISGRNSTKLHVHVLFPPTKPDLIWGGKGQYTIVEVLYAIRNDTVTILCNSNGEPAPGYQWLGQTAGARLHILSIQTNTSRTCVASNEMRETVGEVRSSAANTSVSIIVTYPPETPVFEFSGDEYEIFTKNKVTIKENSTFTVTCKVGGFPRPTLRWNVQDGGNSPTLTFTNIRKTSMGNYTCIAENVIKRSFPAQDKKKKVSTDLEINVLYQSKIEVFRVIHNKMSWVNEVTENETITFNCSVDSNPGSSITISFRGNELKRYENTKTLIHTHSVTSCFDDGLYECQAQNQYNKEPSKEQLELTVKCTPVAAPDFYFETNISSAQNEIVTFHFKAIAHPTPEFHWFKWNGSSWNTLKNDTKNTIIDFNNNSSLTINAITEVDYGHYRLLIRNTVGSLEQLYFLKANGKPDQPKMFEHLNEYVTETSTILRWTPGFDGGPDQTFILRYKLNKGSEWTNVSIPDDGGRTLNYTIGELDSGTVYYTELFAVNSEGKSKTLSLTFKTKDKPTLTGEWWIYGICSCVGVLIVAIFPIAWYFRKRLKKRSVSEIIYQNVPLSHPRTSIIYQNLPGGSQTGVSEDRHVSSSKKNTANEPREMTERPTNYRASILQNQEEIELEFEETFSEPTEYYNSLEIINRLEKIKVSELCDYVKDKTDESFSADFQKIPTALQMSCSFARKPENIALNRYRGILPYDDTRVRIDGLPDFFINASYIDGYKRPKAYIACLGPTLATHDNFRTFWKMVWHERSELIVMLTNLMEPSGMKCEQYWPDASQDEMYDDILVSCQKTEVFAEYTLRRFEVSRTTNAGNFCRCLVHLHYTAWPDKKTPEDVTSLLEFRQKYDDIRKTMRGPAIVHCSAGIGRTGVFIAIDKLIMQGKKEGSVNVVSCITKMREQRVKMVQTSEQFKFVFKALAYALNFDCEPMLMENMKEHIAKIDKRTFIKKYKELGLSVERKSKEQIDTIVKNMSHKEKNRRGSDIPDNNNRVYLYLNRKFEDSDYINAVFINSYTCKDQFIMAQAPLPGTESDFLTMICQENCFCMVSMDDCRVQGMKIGGKVLLKEKQSLDIGDFTVSCFICDIKPQYIVRNVTIKNKKEDERSFYHFQYKMWTAESDTPRSVEEFVEFIKDVMEYEKLGEENSHILVYCLRANERSGLFCAIAIIMEKLIFDKQISVMNTLRHLRTRRQTAITSMEQLRFCYNASLVIAAQLHQKGTSFNNSITT